MSEDPGLSLTCPVCGARLIYTATYPPDHMFAGVSDEDKRLRQVHSYKCHEHGLFHLHADGRLSPVAGSQGR